MTGLNAYSAKLAAITACYDNRTDLMTGIFTVWGEWTETGWTDLQRLNSIGKQSAAAEFDDNAALSDAGLSGLVPGQEIAFQRYWFQEASPDQEQWYLLRKEAGEVDQQEWTAARQKMFSDADINDDGALDYNEAQRFLRAVRKFDRAVPNNNQLDEQLERINNHWFVASLSSTPND